MITFYHHRKENGLYHCESVRSFNGFAPDIRREFTGTVDQLRDELGKDYFTHLLRLLLMFKDYQGSNGSEFSGIHQAKLEKLERFQEMYGYENHISLARAFCIVDYTAICKPEETAHYFVQFLQATINHVMNDTKSLWARGPVELLDGTIVEPWKNQQDENRPAA